jgi:putative Holliday junction resolvase
MRAMGFDVGTKTVGIAVADELGFSAQPITTLRRTNIKADLAETARLVNEYRVTHLIVGLALNMNGSEGPRAEHCRKFGDAIASMTALPVLYWDERLTSVAAEKALIEADVSRAKRKQVVDQVAAVFILQGWLDAQSLARDPG